MEKNASEKKSGAGQYFTPRALINIMTRLVAPQPGERCNDPACGTFGFMIAADRYIKEHSDNLFELPVDQQEFQRTQAFSGCELVHDTHRLALMNAMLHDIDGPIYLGDTLSNFGKDMKGYDVVLTNPPFGTKKGGERTTRDDIQTAGSWFVYGWDLTQNVMELYKSNGTIATSYSYAPFGEATQTGSITNPLQWSSEVFDGELGLVYYNHRHYNPLDGRWIKRYKIRENIITNNYVFINNKPKSDIDILGLYSWGDFGIDLLSAALVAGDVILGGSTGEGIGPAIALQGMKTGAKIATKEAAKKVAVKGAQEKVKKQPNVSQFMMDTKLPIKMQRDVKLVSNALTI